MKWDAKAAGGLDALDFGKDELALANERRAEERAEAAKQIFYPAMKVRWAGVNASANLAIGKCSDSNRQEAEGDGNRG